MFIERAKQGITGLEGSERGGVISGYSPIHSHVQLYLVQISFIVILCSILGQVVKKWNQPRVIAEVRWVALGRGEFIVWHVCVWVRLVQPILPTNLALRLDDTYRAYATPAPFALISYDRVDRRFSM